MNKVQLPKETEASIQELADLLDKKGYKDKFYVGTHPEGRPADVLSHYFRTKDSLEDFRQLLWVCLETEIKRPVRGEFVLIDFTVELSRENRIVLSSMTIHNMPEDERYTNCSIPLNAPAEILTRKAALAIADKIYMAEKKKKEKKLKVKR